MLIEFNNIDIIGVIVAAAAPFALGFLWYGKPLFGDLWQKEVKLSKKDIEGVSMAPIMLFTFLANVVTALFLNAILTQLAVDPSFADGFLTALGLGIGFSAMAYVANYLFAQKSSTLLAIDAGYVVINTALVGGIIALFV